MKNITSLNDYKESNSKKASKPLGSSKMAELMTFSDIINDMSEPPDPIVGDGVLLDNTILEIVGEAKSKKTFLALNMSVAIASGNSFAGLNIERQSRVLHLSAEGGYFPTRERIQTISQDISEEALSNIYYPKYYSNACDGCNDGILRYNS